MHVKLLHIILGYIIIIMKVNSGFSIHSMGWIALGRSFAVVSASSILYTCKWKMDIWDLSDMWQLTLLTLT